jgi:hypothetical protein
MNPNRTETLGQIFERTDWRQLMREGVIVKLTLRRWRAKTKLELADLGLDVNDIQVRQAYREVLRLGDKLLLPATTIRQLDNIDSCARKLLERMSYKTAFGRFVPYTAFEAWQKENGEWERQYYEVRDSITSDYAGIVWRLEQDYKHAARQAWNILASSTPERVRGQDPEPWMEQFVRQVKAKIPSPATIADSFAYETNLLQISFPSLTEAQADERPVSVSDVARMQDEQEQDRRALAERERMLAEMNRAIVRDAQTKKEQIVNEFLSDLATQARAIAYETLTDVLAVVADSAALPSQSARRLGTLIEQIARLNFYGDADMETVLTTATAIIDQRAKDRDPAEIRKQLRALATLMRRSLMDLGEAPRSARDLDVPDEVSEQDVRQARLELTTQQAIDIAEPEPRQQRLDEDLAEVSGNEGRRARN